MYAFGWTATLALIALSLTHHTYVVGLLLAVVFFAAAPANAMLFAVQIDVTPPELQGRVISAAMLTAGIAAPVGPLLAGFLLDHTGQAPTFLAFSALVAALTITMQCNTAIRTMRRPGEQRQDHNRAEDHSTNPPSRTHSTDRTDQPTALGSRVTYQAEPMCHASTGVGHR
jgi:MFS family permease